MQMMRKRGVWTVNLTAVLIGFGMYNSFVLVPELVELPKTTGFGFGASVTGAGLFMLPSTVAMLLVSPLAGRLSNRFGSRVPLILGAVAATISFAMLAVAHSHRYEIYLATAVLGIGIALAFASMANLIVEAVPPEQTGVATGMNTITRTVGGALGSTIGASVIAGSVGASGLPRESGFTAAFALCAVGLALGILTALLVPRPGRRTPELRAGRTAALAGD
jgi:MFS family permease